MAPQSSEGPGATIPWPQVPLPAILNALQREPHGRSHSGAFCWQFGKPGECLQLVRCQEVQEVQETKELQEVQKVRRYRSPRRYRRYRRYRRSRSSSSITGTPELPGLSLGLHSRRVPHACMDVLCSLLFTGQWLHLQTGAHRAQILSCPCPCPLCAGGCALPCSVLDAPWPFASLLAAAAPAAWTSAHKARAFLFLFPLTLMNGLYLNAKAHLFLN